VDIAHGGLVEVELDRLIVRRCSRESRTLTKRSVAAERTAGSAISSSLLPPRYSGAWGCFVCTTPSTVPRLCSVM
jgi:hypothetical protein